MLSTIVTKCLDKNTNAVLCHLFYQSHRFGSINCSTKTRPLFLTLKSNFTYILDSILKEQIVFGNTSPRKELEKVLLDNAIGYKYAVNTLMDILKVDLRNAKSMVKEDERFDFTTCKTMKDNYKILQDAGMSLDNIQKNTTLLLEKSNILENKIANVQKFVDDINSALPLLFCSEQNLSQFIESILGVTSNNTIRNTIKLYRQRWNVQNEKELCILLSRYLTFFIREPENIVKMIELLLNNGVTIKSLLTSKKWNLLANFEEVKKRLEKCSELKFILHLGPWITNCSDAEFDIKTQMYDDKNQLLEDKLQVIEFLSKQSGYSTLLVDHRLDIYVTGQTNLKKVKAISDIIIREGYAMHDLIWSINVLTVSEEVIINRFSQLHSINYKSPFLDFLLLSDREFLDFVNECKNE